MKKVLTTLLLVASSSIYAASGTIEYQNLNGVGGAVDQKNVNLTFRESINKNFSADVQFSNTWNQSNGGASGFRLETGGTGSTKLFRSTSIYTRLALGQRFTSTDNFTYYSVEPGLTSDLGHGFTARLGYRYRTALHDQNINNDTTQTVRAGVGYSLSKKDSIGVRFDRVRGDSNQNTIALNYTRSF